MVWGRARSISNKVGHKPRHSIRGIGARGSRSKPPGIHPARLTRSSRFCSCFVGKTRVFTEKTTGAMQQKTSNLVRIFDLMTPTSPRRQETSETEKNTACPSLLSLQSSQTIHGARIVFTCFYTYPICGPFMMVSAWMHGSLRPPFSLGSPSQSFDRSCRWRRWVQRSHAKT